ncbi:hypothetical protein HCN44_006791 [Aphidius gifuensis]|uniref:SET domain-containing protein n=1 Tax=Aphidius gifuensis TaxID=684658 RepID=A0A835CT70_APHGI|nr:hypothetical protein HCN44_006791 [Aphidius gifuensis]
MFCINFFYNKDVEEKFPTNEFDIWSDTFGQRIYEFVEATTPLFNDDNYIKQIIISKAIKEAGGCVDNLMSELDRVDAELDPMKKGFTNNVFDTKKFISIYSLSSHLPNDDLKTSIHAYPILIAHQFATRTTFFGTKLNDDLRELKDNKKFILLVKLIQRLMLINSTNRSSVMILDEEYKIQTAFHGIYTSVCFFNHGCHSTLASSVQGDTLIMTTANLIKKGEQIFYNYGPHYKNESLDERQIELKEHYYFECKCLACVGKWPMNFSKLSSLKKELEDQHYLDLMIKLIKVNDKFIWATDSIVKFGRRHSKVPDVSLAINDMIKLIDKSSTRYGKHSKQTLFIVSKFEKFLSNSNSPYVRLQ